MFIITYTNGTIKENVIRIHKTISEASAYGVKEYGFGQFVIKKYSQWKKTKRARYEQTRIKTLERIRKFK